MGGSAFWGSKGEDSRTERTQGGVPSLSITTGGSVNYFRVGNSSQCFGYIKDWVEKRIRRHLMSARKRRGFGWDRWSRAWFYKTLGLFNDYGVRHYKA